MDQTGGGRRSYEVFQSTICPVKCTSEVLSTDTLDISGYTGQSMAQPRRMHVVDSSAHLDTRLRYSATVSLVWVLMHSLSSADHLKSTCGRLCANSDEGGLTSARTSRTPDRGDLIRVGGVMDVIPIPTVAPCDKTERPPPKGGVPCTCKSRLRVIGEDAKSDAPLTMMGGGAWAFPVTSMNWPPSWRKPDL